MADSIPGSGANGNLNAIMELISKCDEDKLAEALNDLLSQDKNSEEPLSEPIKNKAIEIIINSGINAETKIAAISRIGEIYGYSGLTGNSLFHLLLESKRFEEAAILVAQNKVDSPDSEDLEKIDLSKLGMDIRKGFIYSLASRNIFIESLFDYGIAGFEDSSDTGDILRALSKAGKYHEIAGMASRNNLIMGSRFNFMTCVNAYLETGNWEGVLVSLKRYGTQFLGSLDEYRKICSILLENDENEMAREFILEGLKTFPDDFDLQRLRVEYLMRKGDNHEAFTMLQDLFDRGTLDQSWKLKTVRLASELGLNEDCIRLVSKLEPQEKDKEIRKFEIESLMKLGRFDEASKALAEAEKTSPDSEDLKYLKYQLMRSLQKQNEAYDLAIELVKMGSRIEDVITYLFEWLFSLGEYKDIIEIYRKFELEDGSYIPYVASSMLSNRDFKSAFDLIEAKPDILFSPPVVDSIFYYVRSEDIVKTLESLATPENVLLKTVIQRLRGLNVSRVQNPEDIGIVRSRAFSFILSFPHYNSPNREVSEGIKTLLSTSRNSEIRDLLEVVNQARNTGKIPSGFIDSMRFMFPVSLALSDGGYLDAAENLVMRSEHVDSDPFYNFIRHRIEYGKSNYGQAKKFLSKALHSLTNFEFLQDFLFLLILTDDRDMEEYLKSMEERGWNGLLDTERLYTIIKSAGKWGALDSIISVVSRWGLKDQYILRLGRDYHIGKGQFQEALVSSDGIFRSQGFTYEDAKTHLELLDKTGRSSEKLSFLDDVETEQSLPETHVIHGDLLFTMGRMKEALAQYELAIKEGINLKENRNYISALIESGRENEAADILGKTDDPYLMIRVYHRQHRIIDALELLKKYSGSAEERQEIYVYAAQNLWYNRDVQDTLMEIFNEKGYLFLGKVIAAKLYDQGESGEAVKILRNISRNYPQNLEIKRILIDMLVKSGERDEAITLILNNLSNFKEYKDLIEIIRTLYHLYFEDREYGAITKFYETNPDYIDSDILQYIVRSYIETEDFDTAERVISRYEGTAMPTDMHSELLEDLNFKKEFVETMFFVSKLFKAEYKEGRTFDRKEAFYKAGIPVEKLAEVYTFLDSRDFYHDVNPEKYEIFSRDVVQKAVKSCKLENIRELQMNVIYNNLDRKDPVLARNLYIYIKEQLETPRKPKYRDTHFLKLLKIMLKEEIKPEPLHVAYGLKIGISESLDVLAIYHHIDKVQDQHGA